MKNTILYITVLSVLFTACYKDIELYQNNDTGQKPVIYSYLFTDSTIKVFVTRTAYPGQLDTSIWLDNAQVNIYENGQLLDNSPEYQEDVLGPSNPFASAYVSSFKPIAGNTYTIQVNALEQTAEATVQMPQPVNITTFQTIAITTDTTGYPFTKISGTLKLSFADPDGEENYYLLTVYTRYPLTSVQIGDSTVITAWQNISLISPFNQNSSSGLLVTIPPGYITGNGYAFSDLRYNGQQVDFLININGQAYAENNEIKIYAALMSINKSLYEYYISVHQMQQSRMSPFTEPSNVYTNVQGGYGLVSGLTVTKDSIVIGL